MEYYDGVYVFGKVDKAFYPTSGSRSRVGNTIELAPGIYAKVLDERVSLCHTSKKQTHVCFWEGDCQVELSINGKRITINDHDEDKGKRSYFTFNGKEHYVQGRLFHLDDDEVTRLHYTVYRDEEVCAWNSLVSADSEVCKEWEIKTVPFNDRYSKEDVTETHYVNEVFTVSLYDNPTTGYSTRLEPSDGLMIVGQQSSLTCTNPGCGSSALYYLKAVTSGQKTLLIHTGQAWDPSTTRTEVMHFNII